MKIYVGNLDHSASGADLEHLFSSHGPVVRARVVMERQTGRSRGFGFVEMGTDDQARAAIAALDGLTRGGRALSVCAARPKREGEGTRQSFGGSRGR